MQYDTDGIGSLTTGTVVLAAHGGRAKVNGINLGTKLGKKSPQEIVAYLTENTDPKKRLSTKFTGTVHLSGCFTAAGGIAPAGEEYDYDTFAGKVKKLLEKAGIKKCSVVGHPGTASTKNDGDKRSIKPTEQDKADRLKKE